MRNDNLKWKGLRRSDPDRPRPLADAVLRLIWEKKRISRSDIAREAGLSRSTVSEIINEILPLGLVNEVGEGSSSGGRRPILLEFQDDSCVILGVEMGGAHVAVALTDLRGKVLVWKNQDHPVRTDPVGTRQLIATLCQECLDSPECGHRPLVGIGVAVSCPINPANPQQLSPIVLPEWNGQLGLEFLSQKHGVPMFVDNDANLGALAEYWWGVSKNSSNISYIKVATGIGSGHILDGEIYRGATGVAGEIGHLPIDPKGKPCICGLRGCLVTMVGGLAIKARASELATQFPDSDLTDKEITSTEVEIAALKGDPLAIQVVQEAAENLGIAVAGMLNLLNPEVVILGGNFSRLGEMILGPLRQTVRDRTLVSSVAAVNIQSSELGPRSVAVGASTLVLKQALSDSRLFPRATASDQAG